MFTFTFEEPWAILSSIENSDISNDDANRFLKTGRSNFSIGVEKTNSIFTYELVVVSFKKIRLHLPQLSGHRTLSSMSHMDDEKSRS